VTLPRKRGHSRRVDTVGECSKDAKNLPKIYRRTESRGRPNCGSVGQNGSPSCTRKGIDRKRPAPMSQTSPNRPATRLTRPTDLIWASRIKRITPRPEASPTGAGLLKKSSDLLCKGKLRPYELIDAEKEKFPIALMCKMLKLAKSDRPNRHCGVDWGVLQPTTDPFNDWISHLCSVWRELLGHSRAPNGRLSFLSTFLG
jgi:hypothetical protein